MGVFLSDELDTLTAQPIIDRLMKTIDEISHNIYTNYIQDYVISRLDEVDFELDYIPLEHSIFFMINGVAYTNNDEHIYYVYNEINNTITWINQNLPLEVGFRVSIVYSFDMDINNTNLIQVYNNTIRQGGGDNG